MEPIKILVPPKEAFNKNRPISDLIKAQITHFQHLENKLPADLRRGIPQHKISTEDDAARYIAAMTRFLRARPAAVAPAAGPVEIRRRPAPISPLEGLALAASAAPEEEGSAAKNKGSNAASAQTRAKRPSRKGAK